jgi:gluconokinase
VILIIMGVSGAGKSTIGQRLAEVLGWPFFEGDDFHSPANIQKMAKGLPLTDADRADWLAVLAQLIHQLDGEGKSAVITCSALKAAYRQKLKGGAGEVRFVFLKGSHAQIHKRMQTRRAHYMQPKMLESQFKTLEEPKASEALTIDVKQTPKSIVRQIMHTLNLPGNVQS